VFEGAGGAMRDEWHLHMWLTQQRDRLVVHVSTCETKRNKMKQN
jgi:hypothetical protein